MKHTKGKVKTTKEVTGFYVKTTTGIDVCQLSLKGKETDEWNANAELIAEAFNVTEESGLTPSVLLKQNKELFKILDDVRSKIYPITKGYQCQIPDDLFKMIDTSVYNHKQAINNASK